MNKQIYYRLIALWAVCEGLIGGVVHGFKLPISGLVVGSCAIVCISLIARCNTNRGSILKATILVAIFKMMLSPQSPPMAYVAVFFQGLMGELIFIRRKRFVIGTYILAIISLLESALQRLLIMMIVFGKDIFTAFDAFLTSITGNDFTNSSYIIAAIYILVHLVAGIAIAHFTNSIRNGEQMRAIQLSDITDEKKSTKPRSFFKYLFGFIWIMLLIIFVYSKINPEQIILPQDKVVILLLRSMIIILTWIYCINPLMNKVLKRWLEKKKNNNPDVAIILELIPQTKKTIEAAWLSTANLKGLKRWKMFLNYSVTATLTE